MNRVQLLPVDVAQEDLGSVARPRPFETPFLFSYFSRKLIGTCPSNRLPTVPSVLFDPLSSWFEDSSVQREGSRRNKREVLSTVVLW